MDCRIDITDDDDGTDRPAGQPPQLPFNLALLIFLYTDGPIPFMLSQNFPFGDSTFLPTSDPALITTSITAFPYFQENNKYVLGNLALIKSPFSDINSQTVKFGVNIQLIETEVI